MEIIESKLEEKYEHIIQELMEADYGVLDNFLEEKDVRHLRDDLYQKRDQELFRRAGIGKEVDYQENKEIRGDSILWLDEKKEETRPYFNTIDQFVKYLNYTCYTGIRSYEFHYAVYPPGTYYQRHLDIFRNDDSRKFSVVFYLNEGWKPEDGGVLRIYKDEKQIDIKPVWNRLVCFASDKLEHEVLPTTKERLSITGWFRNRLRPGGMYLFD